MSMEISVLSQRSAKNSKPQFSGKIRGGIKILNATARANPKAVDIYNSGVAAQKKFSEIEKEITDSTGIKNPLFPRNVQYFTVARSDFGMPEVVNQIMKWAEVRDGDPEPRLYRFPVVFHSSDLAEVFPNQFRRFGGKPNYESNYGDDGVRYCQYLPEVTQEMIAEQKAKRIKRVPRRKLVNRGVCDPFSCPEYLSKDCGLIGTLRFYIPGVHSSAPLVLELKSEYAAEDVFAELERVIKLIGGIPKTNPYAPGKPIFWITKELEPRKYFDEKGEEKKGMQWVVKLQVDLDYASVLQNLEVPQITHSAPAAWLAAPKGMPEALVLPQAQRIAGPATVETNPLVGTASREGVVDNTTGEVAFATQQASSEEDLLSDLETLLATAGLETGTDTADDYFALKVGAEWQDSRESIQKAIGIMNDFAARGAVGISALMGIAVKVNELEISQEDFAKYALTKYQKGYTKDAHKLADLLKHLVELSEGGKEMAQEFIKATLHNAAVPA